MKPIYKIKCHNDNHCEAVQRQLFANGFKWALHGQEVRDVEELTLYIHSGTKQIRILPICWFGECSEVIEITLSELLQK